MEIIIFINDKLAKWCMLQLNKMLTFTVLVANNHSIFIQHLTKNQRTKTVMPLVNLTNWRRPTPDSFQIKINMHVDNDMINA